MQVLSLLENVSSVTPATNLVDGAVYTFEFSYQDDANDDVAAAAQHTGVVFAHNKTIPPILVSPASSTSYTAKKPLEFYLWEKALPSSVKMTISFSHMGRWATGPDNRGDRTYTWFKF